MKQNPDRSQYEIIFQKYYANPKKPNIQKEAKHMKFI